MHIAEMSSAPSLLDSAGFLEELERFDAGLPVTPGPRPLIPDSHLDPMDEFLPMGEIAPGQARPGELAALAPQLRGANPPGTGGEAVRNDDQRRARAALDRALGHAARLRIRRRLPAPLVLVIVLLGVTVGAGAAAFLFHDRTTQILSPLR